MGGRLRHEHLHRYSFAQGQVSGLTVLDAASGTGYGTAMLGEVARCVVGLDLSAEAVAQSRTEFPAKNLSFMQGDCCAMPFAAASFDAVVSFETIEHLREHEVFLDEVRRVLRPGGLLIISTPDSAAYNAELEQPNAFHLAELSLAEFEALLMARFGRVEIMGQRLLLGSAMLPRTSTGMGLLATAGVEVGSAEPGTGAANLTFGQALPSAEGAIFLVARCSDGMLPPLAGAASLFLDSGEDLWPETARVLKWASGIHGEYVAMQTRALGAEATLAEASLTGMAALATELRQQIVSVADIQAKLVASEAQAGAAEARFAAALETQSQAQAHALQALVDSVTRAGTGIARDIEDSLAREVAELRGWVARLRHAETEEQQRQGRRLLRRYLPRLARAAPVLPATAMPNPAEAWPEPDSWSQADRAWQHPAAPPMAPHRADRSHLSSELRDYWLPQRLRDHLFERYGDASIALVERLMAIVARYAKDQPAFARSALAETLVEEAARLAAEHAVQAPDVSIIIPAHNNLPFTLTCIVSLLATASRYSFEILVGDDRSTDTTQAAIGAIGGNVRLVRHATNLGFLRNCNRAAEQARGRFVVFLNNDTIALPGWLDGLIDVFADHPMAGLSGSKLLNADGSLQEAGGIFWEDGSAWNFGRGGNPRAPEFNYVKPVDYISGASIALPTTLWRALGGFDRIFSPAYYEDSDLAFRVRAAGHEVLYTPLSELIHHEGQSHGTDVTQGVKRFQVVNGAKFLARWGGVLAAGHFPNGEEVSLARDRSRGRRHILIIDHYVPQRDRDAGSRAMHDVIAMFASAGLQVHFWPDNLYEDVAYVRDLQRMGAEVIYSAAWSGRIVDWLQAHAGHLDAVLLSRPHIAERYLYDVRANAPAAQVLYYGHDLHWRRLENEAATTGQPALLREAATTRQIERALFRESDILLYLSDEETELARADAPEGRVCLTVPIYHFTTAVLAEGRARAVLAGQRRGHRLLFVGGFAHPPNVDGILWFAGEVLPGLRARIPGLEIAIIGSKAPEAVLALHGPGVQVMGFVPDRQLAALYADCDAVVAPLRYGAGMKGKVIEALAMGVPLVSTSVGLQGIGNDPAVALRADTAEEFAAAVERALTDRPGAAARALAAVDYITAHYTADAMLGILAPHMPALAEARAPAKTGEVAA